MAPVRHGAGNLPAELTSFVGRRGELAEVKRLLAGSRLVTLTGVGGVGKTRLALRAAAGMRRAFRDGVWLVPFDQLRDEALVAQAVAGALRLQDRAGHAPAASLSEFLAGRQSRCSPACPPPRSSAAGGPGGPASAVSAFTAPPPP